MFQKYDYGNSCWWCGDTATTNEHKYKRTDIEREFENITAGKMDGDGIVIVKDGATNKLIPVQSSNSKRLTYVKSLCSHCNNVKSQPFDKAYDEFIVYILNNLNKILEKKNINFSEIFPSETYRRKQDVFRYFAKNFCCRLRKNKILIEPQVIDFLNYKSGLETLLITFEMNMDNLALLNLIKRDGCNDGFLNTGKLYIMKDVQTHIEYLHSKFTYKWFITEFYYAREFSFNNYPDHQIYYNMINIPVTIYSNLDHSVLDNMSEAEVLEQLRINRKNNLN